MPDGACSSAAAAERLFYERFHLHRLFPRSGRINSYFRTYMTYGNEAEVEQVCGVAFIFKGSVLSEIGFFDEKYFLYFEESDFCLRAVRTGLKLH